MHKKTDRRGPRKIGISELNLCKARREPESEGSI
jgi:hypothetical protein